MSLEESMKYSADAQIKLADAMIRYADVMENFLASGGTFAGAEAAPEKTTPEKKSPGRPKKDAPKKEEPEKDDGDDGFGDDDGSETETALDMDTVKAKLFEVKDKFGDKKFALEIIREYGYKALPEIQEKDFRAIYDDAVARLKKSK